MSSSYRRRCAALLTSASGCVLMVGTLFAAAPAYAQQGEGAAQPGASLPPGAAANTPPPATTQSEPITSAPQSAAGSTAVSEVVVTAQFRQQNVQRTPLAVTAVNAAILNERGYTDISDVSNLAPNVTFEKGNGLNTGAAQFYIRGVGQYDIIPAVDPGVGVYIDDVYFGSTYGADFDLVDLDRVEILRGPQATLAGFNSIGGAVKLFSQKPTGSAGGYLEAGYGSNDKLDLRGSFDLPLITDKLFLRISGASVSDDGYIDRIDYACAYPALAGTLPRQNPAEKGCVIGHEGGSDDKTVRAALRWLPTDRLEVNLNADVEVNSDQPSPNSLLAINSANVPPGWQAIQVQHFGIPLDDRFIVPHGQYVSYDGYTDPVLGYTIDPNGHDKAYGMEGTIDYRVTDHLSLKSITAYRTTNGYLAADIDGTPLQATGGTYDIDYRQFTEEDRLNGDAFNKVIDYTVGAFYFDSHQTFDQFVDAPEGLFFLPGGLTKTAYDHVKEDSYAGYVTTNVHPTSQLTLIGGYRFTHSEKTYVFDDLGIFVPLLDIVGEGPPAISDRSDYRASIQYQWTPQLMTYVQYSTGFKAGGINPTPATVAQALPFGPETSTTYELGLKSEFWDRRVRLDLAAFTNKYRGYQTDKFQADGSSIYTNAGTARIEGAEAELEARPIENLLVDASFSYLHYYWEYLNTGAIPGVPDLQGPCITCTNLYTPTYKGDFGIQYAFQLGERFGSLTPRFDADYVGRMFADPQNTVVAEMPHRWVANLHLTWRSSDPRWEATLAITNLFDKFYYVNTNAAEYSETGFAAGGIGRPREVMFTVRRTF